MTRQKQMTRHHIERYETEFGNEECGGFEGVFS